MVGAGGDRRAGPHRRAGGRRTLSGGEPVRSQAPPAAYAARRRELLATSDGAGGGGAARRRGLAALTDSWLRQVFTEAVEATGVDQARTALVAVGGYGRGELAPGSDLDLLLLADRLDSTALAERVWYPVWDSGVRLDHAVRTVEQARRLADADLAVLLGLLDARPVAGNPALVARLRAAVLGDWRAAAARRLPRLRAAWEERGERAGDLRHDLEPDLKDGRGGVRDVVSLRAVAASWVADRPHRGVDEAVSRLADVRDALHLSTGRSGNRLLRQEQDPVAVAVGLADAEALLREVGAAAATVSHAGEVTWRRALQATRPQRSRFTSRRRPVLRLLGPGLAEHDGEAVLTAAADPRRDPLLVLRLAARAARAGLPLAPSSLDRLAVDAVRLPEPWPEDARQLFVELLGAGPPLVPVWEALDQAGLVDLLLPEWSLVRHLPQRNAVHRFSVDRHLLECAVQAAGLVREVSRPDLLLVAALLHDIGKGAPGRVSDHSAAGEPLAVAVATRLGLDAADVSTVARLVRHHLLLVQTATRRDLDDPVTAAAVAAALGSAEAVQSLWVLTRADALATGPAAWSEWKAGLVADLVRRTASRLDGRAPVAPEPLTAAQQALAGAGRLAVVVEPAGSRSWSVTVVAPDRTGLFAACAGVLALHRLAVRSAKVRTEDGMAVDVWTVAPERDDEPRADALRIDLARALDADLDLAARLGARDAGLRPPAVAPPPPRVEVVGAASDSASVLEVRAGDRPGLLYRLGRALAEAGVDVRSARVATLGAEAVDVFYLQDGAGRPLSPAAARETVRLLAAAAAG